MKSVMSRELKHATAAVMAGPERGAVLAIMRRGKVVVTLYPAPSGKSGQRPDFAARRRETYGSVSLEKTATALMGESLGER